jgi:hypothetical protein
MLMKAALTETKHCRNEQQRQEFSAMSCPHGRGNTPQKVGYDESVSNLMFNEESGWMTAHPRATDQVVDHRAQLMGTVKS